MEKISGTRWLEVIEEVHKVGLKTNATMLFGHVESYRDRVDHLAQLRRLQDRTGGFQAFIPLAFQPDNTRVPGAKGAGGVDALKTLAISRLYLDNFRHIKAYWVMLGLKVAQVALCFGVNDLDGTVVEEQIGHVSNRVRRPASWNCRGRAVFIGLGVRPAVGSPASTTRV